MSNPSGYRLLVAAALGLGVIAPRTGSAQRRQVQTYDVWVGTSGEQHLIGHWAGSLSIEHRRSNGGAVPRQMNFTATFLRDLGPGRLGLGLAHYHTSSNDHIGPARPQNERRVFQQLTASHRLFGGQLNHRLRYEQRWVGSDPLPGAERAWRYTTRARHQLRLVRALDGRSTVATKVYAMPSLEGFVRTTDHHGVFFEQTRAGFALGVGVASRMNVEVGYVRQMTIRTDEVREVHDALQVGARFLGHARR